MYTSFFRKFREKGYHAKTTGEFRNIFSPQVFNSTLCGLSGGCFCGTCFGCWISTPLWEAPLHACSSSSGMSPLNQPNSHLSVPNTAAFPAPSFSSFRTTLAAARLLHRHQTDIPRASGSGCEGVMTSASIFPALLCRFGYIALCHLSSCFP